jgi:glucose-6-phosphate 1-dehydrogenase
MSDSRQADLFVILGATGDLSQKMLFPSLYFLDADGLLPANVRILGAARSAIDQKKFLAEVREHVGERAGSSGVQDDAWERFAKRLSYCTADAAKPEGAEAIKEAMGEAATPVFYLALSPSLFAPVCLALKKAGAATPTSRVVLEKPVGHDLETSRKLNEAVAEAFSEDRVFRIDHYLGKETVQNLIALRFGNTLFEPLWNNLAVDHVQITVAETVGVGDRWPYYDNYGALRDMLQNHMLQLLCLVAMEPPADLDPDSVRNEKVKVLRSLRPYTRHMAMNCTVRGQYTDGVVEGQPAPSYESERGQPSGTETFAALRVDIDNWRWAGVPFFLRTGKRLPEKRTQVVIQFKGVPHSIFGDGAADDLTPNRLVIDLQPDEDIQLTLMNKAPGLSERGMRLQSMPLSLSLAKSFEGPDARRRIAYEPLLLEVMKGVTTLFVRRDEVEQAWQWIDGVADAWSEAGMAPKPYAAGTWGPAGAFALIERFNRAWYE